MPQGQTLSVASGQGQADICVFISKVPWALFLIRMIVTLCTEKRIDSLVPDLTGWVQINR